MGEYDVVTINQASVIMTPALSYEQLGIEEGMARKIVNIRIPVFLVAYWRPAAVPTRMRPGSWMISNTAFRTLEEAQTYVAGTHMIIIEGFSVEAREVWFMPVTGEP